MSKKAKRKTLPMQSYRWLKNGTFQIGRIWGQPRNHLNFPRFLLPLTVTDSRVAVGALSPAARCRQLHSSNTLLSNGCHFLVDWGTQLLQILLIGAYRVMVRVACLWLVGLAYRSVQPACYVLWGVLHVYVRHEAERWARQSASSPFTEVVSIGEGVQKGKTYKKTCLCVWDGRKKEVVFKSLVEMTMISCQVWRSSILWLPSGWVLASKPWRWIFTTRMAFKWLSLHRQLLIWMLEEDTKIL